MNGLVVSFCAKIKDEDVLVQQESNYGCVHQDVDLHGYSFFRSLM